MTTYSDAIAKIRAARQARDAAQNDLYTAQLRRLTLARALGRQARGDTVVDPAIEAQLAALNAQVAAIDVRQSQISNRLTALQGVPAAIAALQTQIAAEPKQTATAVAAVNAAAAALNPKAAPAERTRLQDALRAAQSSRADLAVQLQQAADSLSAQQTLAAEASSLTTERSTLNAQRQTLTAQLASTSKQAQSTKLSDQAQSNAATVATNQQATKQATGDLASAIAGLYQGTTPQQLITSWDDSLPIILLPVRLETRWRPATPVTKPPVTTSPIAGAAGAASSARSTNNAPRSAQAPRSTQLCVRIYPDDVEIATHEEALTDNEVAGGQAYWTALQAAGSDTNAQSAAWTTLVDRFGANRAAWVALQTKPTNWAAASTDPTVALQFPPPPVTKPDPWTTAPHSRVLPDRFVLLAWSGATLRVTQVGNPIDDVVILGPSPIDDSTGTTSIDRNSADQTITLGDDFAWVRDFDQAVAKGLGFRVDVTAQDIESGFDRLLVLGLKASADAPDAQALVEQLIDDHHYAKEGFALLKQGTPTNNTDDGSTPYTRTDDAVASTVAQSGPPLFTPTADRTVATDGQRLADLLGVSYSQLQYVNGADLTDFNEAVTMNRALYAGTLGYYLDHMLNDVVDDAWIGTLRRHFTDHVTGRGPIATIRVGSQPYGILPTSSMARWKPPVVRRGNTVVAANAPPPTDPFETALLRALLRFEQGWTSLASSLLQVNSPGDADANLMTILGLQPTSAEFYQRVGYSYDYLQNLGLFTSSGGDLQDVLNLMLEGQAARQLLADLGYTPQAADGTLKPYPLLLQLIWRHYQTALDQKQLIDGMPFSETAFIKPYDAAGTQTYLDWLVANAANSSALQNQDFGSASPPAALLYLMLYFSVVMEAARGIHGWLTASTVSSDELIRSRTFLNIGAAASPTIWEVFNAPANGIVAAEPSNASLLGFINSTQQAEAAGQSVQEQQAALAALRKMPTARLERALVEHIDTLTYRLDAWQTSLFARRLEQQRNLSADPTARRTGLYLGAYGYLENVKADAGTRTAIADSTLPQQLQQGVENLYSDSTNGGYVHAPSLNHAAAAALLRNGFLTHASSTDPDLLAVNVSSGRVDRAQALLDGIRNGQTLEVLLGVQFERGLHDWTTLPTNPVILDQLKPLFRAQFPILKTLVPQANAASSGTGASQISQDYQVTNGLTLATTTVAFPWGIAQLSTLSAAQQSALQAEQAAIADTLDALRDVLTTESAYQLALGNFDRAAGVLQSAGNGTTPPDIEVLPTPRGTDTSFTQRLAVQLTTAAVANPWPPIALTERAALEPSLNAWLGDLLGDPKTITCTAAALAADGSTTLQDTVSVADLGIQPIDFVYAVRSQTDPSSAAELETRVRYAFAQKHSITDDIVVSITFANAGGVANARAFGEVLPLADRLRRLLGTASPLDGRHFQSASKDASAPANNPGWIDATEVRTRVGTGLTTVRALFPVLQTKRDAAATSGTAAAVDALRSALMDIADVGFGYALPKSAVGNAQPQIDALTQQADSLISRAATLGPATDTQLTQADAATNNDQKLKLLGDAVKAWMGGDTVLLPRFTFPDPMAAGQADAARTALLDYVENTVGVPLPVDEWLHGASCVRPRVHDFEVVRAMADASRDVPLVLEPLQLPFRTGDSWLGAQYPTTMEVVHDTVSVVQHLPQPFVAASAQCGLLIDEWIESVPNRQEVTGLTFNFDAPNSAAPQALLLAVTPEETGSWNWDALVDTVLDTFSRARIRAVEPDALGNLAGIGTLLPAVIAEFGTTTASVSLDYTYSIPEMSKAVNVAMQSAAIAR